jgi:hypothetical protein
MKGGRTGRDTYIFCQQQKECTSMHKPSRAAIYGVIGLAGFGVGYDCGLFGPPDGHDHSVLISIAPSTGTVTGPVTAIFISQNVTGDAVANVDI